MPAKASVLLEVAPLQGLKRCNCIGVGRLRPAKLLKRGCKLVLRGDFRLRLGLLGQPPLLRSCDLRPQ